MPKPLQSRIAVVVGATRGAGRGTGDAFVALTGIAVQNSSTLYVMDTIVPSTTMRLVKVDIATGDRSTLSETGDGNGLGPNLIAPHQSPLLSPPRLQADPTVSISTPYKAWHS